MTVKQVQFAYDSDWHVRKGKLGVTWKQIMEAGINALEGNKDIKKDKPKKEEKEEVNEEFYFHLLPNNPSIKREFDKLFVWTDLKGKERKEWRTVEIDDIEIDAIIRVRDNGKVITHDGHKKLRKRSHMIRGQGPIKIIVTVEKDNVPV